MAVLLSGVVLSFSPLVFRVSTCTDWQYLLCRLLGLSLAASAGLAYSRHRGAAVCATVRRRRVVGAGLLISIANCAFIIALARIDSATAVLMQGVAPIVAALLGRIAPPHEALDGHTALSIVLALAGLALMGTTWASDDPVGLLVAALIPFALGGYTVLLRGASNAERDPWAPLFWSGVFGASAGAVVVASTSGFAMAWTDALLGLGAGAGILGVGLAIFNAGVLASPLPIAPLQPWLVCVT